MRTLSFGDHAAPTAGIDRRSREVHDRSEAALDGHEDAVSALRRPFSPVCGAAKPWRFPPSTHAGCGPPIPPDASAHRPRSCRTLSAECQQPCREPSNSPKHSTLAGPLDQGVVEPGFTGDDRRVGGLLTLSRHGAEASSSLRSIPNPVDGRCCDVDPQGRRRLRPHVVAGPVAGPRRGPTVEELPSSYRRRAVPGCRRVPQARRRLHRPARSGRIRLGDFTEQATPGWVNLRALRPRPAMIRICAVMSCPSSPTCQSALSVPSTSKNGSPASTPTAVPRPCHYPQGLPAPRTDLQRRGHRRSHSPHPMPRHHPAQDPGHREAVPLPYRDHPPRRHHPSQIRGPRHHRGVHGLSASGTHRPRHRPLPARQEDHPDRAFSRRSPRPPPLWATKDRRRPKSRLGAVLASQDHRPTSRHPPARTRRPDLHRPRRRTHPPQHVPQSFLAPRRRPDSVAQPMRFHDLRHSHVALLIA